MTRLTAGAVALGLVAAGSILVAGPAGAGQEPLEMTVSQTTIQIGSGDTVTVSSVDPCLLEGKPGGLDFVLSFEDGTVVATKGPHAPTNADGSWTAGPFAPNSSTAVGEYTAEAECAPMDPADETLPRPYEPVSFTVTEAHEVTTTTTAPLSPEPPAATPVRVQPRVTG